MSRDKGRIIIDIKIEFLDLEIEKMKDIINIQMNYLTF